jgi:hypothetical protein
MIAADMIKEEQDKVLNAPRRGQRGAEEELAALQAQRGAPFLSVMAGNLPESMFHPEHQLQYSRCFRSRLAWSASDM